MTEAGPTRRHPAGPLLRSALRRRRRDTGASAVLVVGHQLCEAAVPVVVGAALDRAVRTGDGGALAVWLGVVVGVFLALASCGYAGYWLMSRAEYAIRRDLRVDLVRRALDPRGGLGRRPGESSAALVGTAGTDAARSAMVVEVVVMLAGTLAAIVAGAVVLLVASPVLAVVVLAGAAVVLVASHLLSGPLVGRAEREQETLAEATAVATDLVEGLRVVKGIGAERAAAESYRATSAAALAARLHAVRLEGGYLSATGALTGAFLVVVAWVAGDLALDGRISAGDLVAAVGLAQFLMEPMERIARLFPLLAGARGAGGRVAHVLAAAPAVADGTEPLPGSPTGRLTASRGDLGVEVAAGEHLGLVSADPADLAPLVRTLGREDAEGTVLLDGADVAGARLDDVRRALVVAHHDAVLFEGSVLDNLRPERADRADRTDRAEDVDWDRVLPAAGADEVLDHLPQGLDTEVGERGRSLSGGQRQRLALARALATEADVLVLHEPTTAVDAATEDRIADGVRRHRAGRTTLLVTSSPALLARCDRVLLVAGHQVVASGTHAALLDDERYRAVVLS